MLLLIFLKIFTAASPPLKRGIWGNTSQLRVLEIKPLVLVVHDGVVYFLHQILGAHLLLWISPNEKQSFVRKASCGAVRLTAKLAKYLLLINKSQKPYFSKIVLPRTVADDISVYRITL